MARRSRPILWLPLGLFVVAVASVPAAAGDFVVTSRNDMIDTMVRIRATQFLQRATFGPTEAEVDALTLEMRRLGVTEAASQWIDDQFALEPTSHVATARAMLSSDGWQDDEDGVNIGRYRDHAWWHNVITAPDQLKQRVAWALMQIVVISRDGSNFNNRAEDNYQQPYWLGISNYYDMLLENSDDTYREVLGDVTFSPIMGVYLSHLRNRKADPARGRFPDENYAREIMQLFSIGLNELNPDGTFKTDAAGELIPTYDNETIKSFARLFTGLTYRGNTRIDRGRSELHSPMVMIEAEHDSDEKVLLNGFTLPANSNGVADINSGLDHLYDHPNVAPFISRLLIQRLVRSNPSRNYLGRVSAVFNDNGQGVKGDMKAVIKAILLDRECWNSIRVVRTRRRPVQIVIRPTGTENNRLNEPVLTYTSFLRRYASPDADDGWYKIPANDYNFTQAPYRSPSVFNFYLPNFQPAGPISSYQPSSQIPNGDLYAPEFELYSSVMTNRMANRFRGDIADAKADYTAINNQKAGRDDVDLLLDFSQEEALGSDPAALARHLDMTLCAGTMSNEFREALTLAVEEEGTDPVQRARGAILSVLMSPASMIVE